MSRSPSKLYANHVANLRELEHAASHVSRLARAAIASRDPQLSLRTLLRLYSFLIGAWLECRLKKLLHEERGLSDAQRAEVPQDLSQLEQWKAVVDIAFRMHHKIRVAPLDERTLGVAHAARRAALRDVLDNELRLLIEIRNKLAHGQWIYPLTNDGSKVESDKYRLINSENLQSLQLKFSLASHLADAIHDLVVSPSTFERDFEEHFRKLFQVRTNLVVKRYVDYEGALVKSREKSRASRKTS